MGQEGSGLRRGLHPSSFLVQISELPSHTQTMRAPRAPWGPGPSYWDTAHNASILTRHPSSSPGTGRTTAPDPPLGPSTCPVPAAACEVCGDLSPHIQPGWSASWPFHPDLNVLSSRSVVTSSFETPSKRHVPWEDPPNPPSQEPNARPSDSHTGLVGFMCFTRPPPGTASLQQGTAVIPSDPWLTYILPPHLTPSHPFTPTPTQHPKIHPFSK